MSVHILVGSFSTFLQVLHFDAAAKTLALTTVPNPAFDNYTWITRHPTLSYLFYATQSPTQGGNGFVSLISVKGGDNQSGDPSQFKLQILQTISSGGIDPCHLGITADGSELAVANYGSSNVLTCKVAPDGLMNSHKTFDLAPDTLPLGPNADRQEAPHPHGCYYTADGQLWVPDLGCDGVRRLSDSALLRSAPGAGPRHQVIRGRRSVAFTPVSRLRSFMLKHGVLPQTDSKAYVVNELDNTVSVYSLERAAPSVALSPIQTHSVLPEECQALNGRGMSAAEVLLSPDGRHLYVTNRDEGHEQGDAVVHFRVANDGLELTKTSEVRTGLNHLRGAELLETQKKVYLITGSRVGKGAVVYACDSETGLLSEVARNREVVQPSCFTPLIES